MGSGLGNQRGYYCLNEKWRLQRPPYLLTMPWVIIRPKPLAPPVTMRTFPSRANEASFLEQYGEDEESCPRTLPLSIGVSKIGSISSRFSATSVKVVVDSKVCLPSVTFAVKTVKPIDQTIYLEHDLDIQLGAVTAKQSRVQIFLV